MEDDKPVWGVLSPQEKLRIIEPLLRQGWSTREIATAFQGATKNSVIGFSHRHINKTIKSPQRRRATLKVSEATHAEATHADMHQAASVLGAWPSKPIAPMKQGLNCNLVPKTFPVRKGDPRNPASLPSPNLVRFSQRRMGRECAYISGSPTEFAMCCGLPVVNHELCAEHFAKCWRPVERSR